MEANKKTKTLWMRVGITFDLAQEEFEKVKSGSDKGAALIREKMLTGHFRLDGETYAPQDMGQFADENQWRYCEDINYDF